MKSSENRGNKAGMAVVTRHSGVIVAKMAYQREKSLAAAWRQQ